MTTFAQITRQAARDDVPAPTVERDYVLAHIVAALGALDDEHGRIRLMDTVPEVTLR